MHIFLNGYNTVMNYRNTSVLKLSETLLTKKIVLVPIYIVIKLLTILLKYNVIMV